MGYYYEYQNDYPNMIKYYLMSIEHKQSDSMYNLGAYYKKQKNYDKMLKYFLMAIECGNSFAMNSLGQYYEFVGYYETMIKYYLMAIELKNSTSMCNLGSYYQGQKDYYNMLKYYEMAVELENETAINNLIKYYEDAKDYSNMMIYYLMEVKLHNIVPIKLFDHARNDYDWFLKIYAENREFINKYPSRLCDLFVYYINGNKATPELLNIMTMIDCTSSPCLEMIKKLALEKIDLMDLHFKYSMEGKGFDDAKNDFFNRIIS